MLEEQTARARVEVADPVELEGETVAAMVVDAGRSRRPLLGRGFTNAYSGLMSASRLGWRISICSCSDLRRVVDCADSDSCIGALKESYKPVVGLQDVC